MNQARVSVTFSICGVDLPAHHDFIDKVFLIVWDSAGTHGERPNAILHPVTFRRHLRFLLNKKLLKIISKSSVHKVVIKKSKGIRN